MPQIVLSNDLVAPVETLSATTIFTKSDGLYIVREDGAVVGPMGVGIGGVAGGSLTGFYPNPGIANNAIGTLQIAPAAVTGAKIAGATITLTNISASLIDPVAGLPGLRTLGSGSQQATAGNDPRLSDARPPSGAASGDLGGVYPGPTIAALQGYTLDLTIAPSLNDVLTWDGTNWVALPGGGGGGTLQSAYDNSPEVSVVNSIGPIDIFNNTDNADLMYLTQDFVGAGVGLSIEMGPSVATSGTALDILVNASSSGIPLHIINNGSGIGVSLTQTTNTNLKHAMTIARSPTLARTGDGLNIAMNANAKGDGIHLAYSYPTADSSGNGIRVVGTSAAGTGVWITNTGDGRGLEVSKSDAGSGDVAFLWDMGSQSGHVLRVDHLSTGVGSSIFVNHSAGVGDTIKVQRTNVDGSPGDLADFSFGGNGSGAGIRLTMGSSTTGPAYISDTQAGATGNAMQVQVATSDVMVIDSNANYILAALAAQIDSTAGLILSGSGTSALVVNGAGTAITVQAGATLATTSTGNINLPNNGSARFRIETVAVSANVTSANLGTLTAGPASNADALHTHTSVFASQIVQSGFDTTTNALGDGDLGYLTTTGNRVAKAIATALTSSVVIGANEGVVGSLTTAGTIENQNVQSGITITAGDLLFLSSTEAGKVTNVPPTTPGEVSARIGIARTNNGGAGADVSMVLSLGTPIQL